MRALVAALALLLGGCGYLGMYTGGAVDEWRAEVAGVNVHYRLVAGGTDGAAAWVLRQCTIALNVDLSLDMRTIVAAHELGHCLDGAVLEWSSNGWRREGCIFGAHYCPPKEGFAQGYAMAYVAACGLARSPLGLVPGDGLECDLPDPRTVTPEIAQRLWELRRVLGEIPGLLAEGD